MSWPNDRRQAVPRRERDEEVAMSRGGDVGQEDQTAVRRAGEGLDVGSGYPRCW
jgi:hypothetical protein